MPRITPFLWFDGEAEEAAHFYVSIFPNSRVVSTWRYPEGSPMPEGTVMTVSFYLDGQSFTALNGGPMFQFTEAVSFVVECQTQDEIDHYWSRLGAGGRPQQCGWVKDRYGLSWQIVPKQLSELLGQDDPGRAQRVMGTLLGMSKMDIAELRKAAGLD